MKSYITVVIKINKYLEANRHHNNRGNNMGNNRINNNIDNKISKIINKNRYRNIVSILQAL